MIRHAIKTLSTTTPVELTIDDNINGVSTLIVQNISETAYVYLGGSSVSSTDYGFMIYPKQAFTVELRPFDRLYAVGSDSFTIACMSIERAT